MLPELVSIPAGSFVMGSRDGARDEQPMRTVHVSAFAFAVHAVTNAEYRRFLVASGHRAPECIDVPGFAAPRQPVVAVSWFDAVAYCAWLASVTGAPCRLPTEAEREKAALGAVDGARYPWGDDAAGLPPAQRADAPDDVCRGAPNGYGLHDLGDLVHEWCSDWYAADAYRDALCRAKQPAAGSHVRGLRVPRCGRCAASPGMKRSPRAPRSRRPLPNAKHSLPCRDFPEATMQRICTVVSAPRFSRA